ncbi:unnamed protein product [Rotaria sordida]|uniref:DUF4371 domain-containing protein n=2 Tax=Rotaria sordida TaxID=392033 RepID=A0A815K458_9BILA|nr:unnamed protein product [Rotaria sordida]CAF3932816.1 unnamed protein product [Rotaria sordida]
MVALPIKTCYDETTDTSTAEQLSLSLRYYDQKLNDIREDFLTFIETVSCTGETTLNIILDYLTTHNLLFYNCVGHAYDGGSNMAGIYEELYIPIVNTLDKFRYGILKDSLAEQLYHVITNFQHIISTCISCFLLSDIVPVSRMLQTETLDFYSIMCLKSERIILLSKLQPKVIVNEKPFELTKHLLKQFADRTPSPLQLNSELGRWQENVMICLK